MAVQHGLHHHADTVRECHHRQVLSGMGGTEQ
nr:MAG TPA: hypothetical protein [Caudoviricetes sp.]